jgi:hypothetical protein
MKNFSLYLIVGLMTFSIGIIASRVLISSQIKEDCTKGFTMTIISGVNSEFSEVILKIPNFTVTVMNVKDSEELLTLLPKTADGKSLFPCQIIRKSSL